MNLDQWKTHFQAKLVEKSVIHHNGECIIWTGYSRDGGRGIFYGEIKASYPEINQKLRKIPVHRLAYFLKHPEHYGRVGDCSHLCHNSLCIKAEHMSLEPHYINNNRQVCSNIKKCQGHAPYQDCLLHLHN